MEAAKKVKLLFAALIVSLLSACPVKQATNIHIPKHIVKERIEEICIARLIPEGKTGAVVLFEDENGFIMSCFDYSWKYFARVTELEGKHLDGSKNFYFVSTDSFPRIIEHTKENRGIPLDELIDLD